MKKASGLRVSRYWHGGNRSFGAKFKNLDAHLLS
jgi:hypothetical protein